MERRLYRPREKFVKAAMAGALIFGSAESDYQDVTLSNKAHACEVRSTSTTIAIRGEIPPYFGSKGQQKKEKLWKTITEGVKKTIKAGDIRDPKLDIRYWWASDETAKQATDNAIALENEAAKRLHMPLAKEVFPDKRGSISPSRNGKRMASLVVKFVGSCKNV